MGKFAAAVVLVVVVVVVVDAQRSWERPGKLAIVVVPDTARTAADAILATRTARMLALTRGP